jgi:hypothetical protein
MKAGMERFSVLGTRKSLTPPEPIAQELRGSKREQALKRENLMTIENSKLSFQGLIII